MAAVAPVGAHGVQRIGDADDPDHLRQLPAFQPGGVAFAVEPLVVVAGTAVGLRQKFQPLENFSAPDGVLLHDVELLVRQPGGFVEDGVRHGDLSDVMEQGAPVEAVQLLAGEAHMRPDEAGIFGHPVGVLAGVAVFFVYHLADGGHRAHNQLLGLADGGLDLTFHLFFALLLLDGFQFIPTLIGLFAVSEVIAGVERIIRGEEHEQKSNEKITNVLPDWKTIKQIWPNILSGGLIGTFIGAIPGAGGDIAVFVSYGASKSASKHPELYGTGIPNGVAATESANNGCSGGAMIPLLSLGVPGDSVTAILLGAFIMKGITPGPMMYVTELPTVYRVFAALMLANLCMLVVGCLGVRFFAKIVSVEKKMLYPIILVISLLGAFSINKNAFDVGVCVAFGIIGWLMNKYEFPLSPILLALILGPMCEKNFVRYMNIQRGNFFAITTSPIAMVFATVAILVIVYSVYNQSKINKRAAANAAQEKA